MISFALDVLLGSKRINRDPMELIRHPQSECYASFDVNSKPEDDVRLPNQAEYTGLMLEEYLFGKWILDYRITI